LLRQFVFRADAPQEEGAQILDTRKTTPGLRTLENAAVAAGAGRWLASFCWILGKSDFGSSSSNPTTKSFWMKQSTSSMVITNLIAKVPFLYRKPEKPAVNRID
jgi:hypothetical protein